jgi:preprotein translocase subunit SecE
MANATEATQQANRAGMDPLRLVLGFYLVATVILGMFLAHVLAVTWVRLGWPNREVLSGVDLDLPTLLGYVLALGTAIFCWVNPLVKARALESASELMKVTWPTWGETRVSTIAVVIASLVAAVILFAIDTLAYQIMVDWLPTLWGRL